MATTQLIFDLIARDRASRQLQNIGNNANQAKSRLQTLGDVGKVALGSALAGGAAAGLGALKTFASGAVDVYARVEDATGAAGVQFGKSAGDVSRFAQAAAKNFGLSEGAALDAANSFGTLGKSAGLQGKPLADFSTQFTSLAADLASFKGTSPEQAIEAVGAALRGEAEPIRAYGVLLDDASLRAEAFKQGLISTTKDALTPQQKVLATQSLLLKQTKDAQGDYARTSTSTANTQKTLAAETENAQKALGQKLAPAVTFVRQKKLELIRGVSSLIGKLGDTTTTVGQVSASLAGMARWTGENKDILIPLVSVIGGAVAGWKAYQFVVKTAAAAQLAFNLVMTANPIGIVIATVAAFAAGLVVLYNRSEKAKRIIDQSFRGIALAGKFMWEGVLRPAFRALLDTWLATAGGIVRAASTVFRALGMEGLANKLDRAGGVLRGFRDEANAALGGIKDQDVEVRARAKVFGVTDASGRRLSVGANSTGRFARGGPVWGEGTATSDSIPAYLSNGEFVINARSAQRIGYGNLETLNRYANGGLVVNARVPRVGQLVDPMRRAVGNLVTSTRALAQRQADAAAAALSIPEEGTGASNPRGLTGQARSVLAEVLGRFGRMTTHGFAARNIAGTRKRSDHALGKAVDFMVYGNRARGNAIADYIVSNAGRLRADNVIWHDRIWSAGRGWRGYRHPSGSNNPTLQHRDHVHYDTFHKGGRVGKGLFRNAPRRLEEDSKAIPMRGFYGGAGGDFRAGVQYYADGSSFSGMGWKPGRRLEEDARNIPMRGFYGGAGGDFRAGRQFYADGSSFSAAGWKLGGNRASAAPRRLGRPTTALARRPTAPVMTPGSTRAPALGGGGTSGGYVGGGSSRSAAGGIVYNITVNINAPVHGANSTHLALGIRDELLRLSRSGYTVAGI